MTIWKSQTITSKSHWAIQGKIYGFWIIFKLLKNRSQKAERTREWLLTHNIEETSEIITANTELEQQVTTVKSERDELAILNENLNERCDMLITQNGKLKSQLHGELIH